jgi:hygromycin-B 7''-O-kinase
MLRHIHSMPLDSFVRSGLFPNQGSSRQLRTSIHDLLGRFAKEIALLPHEYDINPPIQVIVDKVLAALPNDGRRSVLHANPFEEAVFVDPRTESFVGLIDFGDAYIGHPAFDLRPWPKREDRFAILGGYASEGPIDDSFMTTWRIGLVLGILASLVRQLEPLENLEHTLCEILGEL